MAGGKSVDGRGWAHSLTMLCVELQDLCVLHQTNETVKLMPAQQIRWAFIVKCHLKTAARALAATASIIVIP